MDTRPIIDGEIFGMLSVLHQSNAVQQSVLYFELSAMMESLQAGLGQYPLREKSLRRLDANLRLRRKNDICVIEHFDHLGGFWLYVCDWPRDGQGVEYGVEQCVNFLCEHDMQRVGTAEWLRRKRAKAAQIREANEKKADDAIFAAIDGLSNKQVQQFVEVEEALRSGDTVIAHGDDAAKLERIANSERKI